MTSGRRTLAAACLLVSACAVGSAKDVGTSDRAVSVPDQQPDKRSAELAAWFAARWDEQLAFEPMQATLLGRDDGLDRIDDHTEEGRAARFAWRQQTARDLEDQFERDALGTQDKLSYDLWMVETAREAAAWQVRDQTLLLHQMMGPQSQLPSFLINVHPVRDAAGLEAYIVRIEGVASAMEALVHRSEAQVARGLRAPRFAYEAVAREGRAQIEGAPFGGEGTAPIWADLMADAAALVEEGVLGETEADALLTEASAALTGPFQTAYERLIGFAEAQLPLAEVDPTGVGTTSAGDAYYRERVAYHTTTELRPDEIHALGLNEVARIRAEMDGIRRQVGFDGSLDAFLTDVASADRFYYPNTHEGREAYLQAARDHLERIEARLPEQFGTLPSAPLVVRRVEAFREQDGAPQHYVRATPDGSRPGVFYAHLSDMRAMPIPQLEAIAYHEANPGHHLQISIAQERTDLPAFRQQAVYFAYSEGWALYAEKLAGEMGGYADPYSDLGRLTTELWRAARLVVDTGLHAKGWTESEGTDYFLANTPMPEGQARAEVRRYLVWPAQALAYKIGMIEMERMREEAEAALGSRFDPRAYHDVVIRGGMMPLPTLEAVTQQHVRHVLKVSFQWRYRQLVERQFQDSSSLMPFTGWSAMRSGTSVSQARGSMPLSLAVSMRV